MFYKELFLVMVGGAIGAGGRFLVGRYFTHQWPNAEFPWGTFLINFVGCLTIGLVNGLFVNEQLSRNGWWFCSVGILGGFTTFSAFGWDTMRLIEKREMMLALANIVGSNALGIIGAFVGYAGSRMLR